jgi:DNA-binding transcriptional ArsR family regulator
VHNVFTLSDEDLPRVRLAAAPEPMLEAVMAAHPRLDRSIPPFSAFSRAALAELGSSAPQVIRVMQSPAVLGTNFGVSTQSDIAVLDEAIEAAMSQPRSEWRASFDELRMHGLSAERFPGLAEGVPAAMTRVADLVRRFHSVVLAPYWDTMTAVCSAAVAAWTSTVARQGIEALLQTLHPTIHWEPPHLIVDEEPRGCPQICPHLAVLRTYLADRNLRFRISSRGLVIRPTLTSHAVHKSADGEGLATLSVPVHTDPRLFTAPQPPLADPLADLMGSTRARVLKTCTKQPLTTSGLAQRLGISTASASEHASVLRSAGLLQSDREGQSVRHRATVLGIALVNARNVSAFGRGV